MENEEKVLNPQESLRVIRETIDLAKNGVRENGFHFLLWGWLVVLASATNYYLSEFANFPPDRASMAWGIMVLIGLPAAFVYEWRRDKKRPVPNVVRDWYGQVWLAFGISLLVGMFLTVTHGVSPVPFILVLVGFATFVSGTMLRFKPLILGAMAMWVAAIACHWLSPSGHLLAQAAATVVGYLIPGYLLNAQARSRHV